MGAPISAPRTGTGSRQLLGIKLHHDAGTPSPMSHHGRMHAQREEAREEEREEAAQTVTEDISPPARAHPRVASFRSRRSALSGLQRDTWDRRWPELGMLARDSDGRLTDPLDAEAWFGRSAPLVLEIG